MNEEKKLKQAVKEARMDLDNCSKNDFQYYNGRYIIALKEYIRVLKKENDEIDKAIARQPKESRTTGVSFLKSLANSFRIGLLSSKLFFANLNKKSSKPVTQRR